MNRSACFIALGYISGVLGVLLLLVDATPSNFEALLISAFLILTGFIAAGILLVLPFNHLKRTAPAVGGWTAREREILLLIVEGCSNDEIASRLFIARSTVKTHINHLYRKLDTASRTQAIKRARELHLIP